MTSHLHTQSATPINKRERSSRGAPLGTLDQRLFWKDLRHLFLFLATFVAIGVGAVWFYLLPRHEQAMLMYGLIVLGCAFLILAGLRRKANGR